MLTSLQFLSRLNSTIESHRLASRRDATVKLMTMATSWADDVDESNLNEPSYDVEVKVSNLDVDTDNPLSSAKTFEDLSLSVVQLAREQRH